VRGRRPGHGGRGGDDARALSSSSASQTLYTIGNLLSLLSTGFLIGPVRQLKNMFHRKRAVATLIYLGALIGTLAVAFTTHSVIATLLMILVQFCAMAWYTLSYIPYARDVVRKAVVGCFTRGGA
jgi:hypothetical protein